jgi:hypothetical protein
MMTKNRTPLILWLLLLALGLHLSGCSNTRNKIKAGNILRSCIVTFQRMDLSGVEIDSNLIKPGEKLSADRALKIFKDVSSGSFEYSLGKAQMSAQIAVDNRSDTPIWLDSLNSSLFLDTIGSTVLRLSQPVLLQSKQKTLVNIQFELDLNSKLFQLKKANWLKLQGTLWAHLQGSDIISLPIDVQRQIPPGKMSEITDQARNHIIKNLVGDWVKSIL